MEPIASLYTAVRIFEVWALSDEMAPLTTTMEDIDRRGPQSGWVYFRAKIGYSKVWGFLVQVVSERQTGIRVSHNELTDELAYLIVKGVPNLW